MEMLMYRSRDSHCKLVRELKLQSLSHKDILHFFQCETSAKNNKLKQLRL